MIIYKCPSFSIQIHVTFLMQVTQMGTWQACRVFLRGISHREMSIMCRRALSQIRDPHSWTYPAGPVSEKAITDRSADIPTISVAAYGRTSMRASCTYQAQTRNASSQSGPGNREQIAPEHNVREISPRNFSRYEKRALRVRSTLRFTSFPRSI